MTTGGIPWQRAAAVLATVAVALGMMVAVLRADGFTPVDATVPRATRWFVHQATGRVVLADGFSGKALARLDTTAAGAVLELAQGATAVSIVDRSAATARSVDASALRLGPAQSVSLAARPSTIIGVGQTGLVAVDPTSAEALLLPPEGDAVPFDIGAGGAGANTRIAPDGSVWTLATGRLSRVTTIGRETLATGLGDGRFSLVGNSALVLDVTNRRVELTGGSWWTLPTEVPISEVVLQEPSPAADCGWIGVDDQLWCIGRSGLMASANIAGLGIDGADLLAIAGDAAALVRRSASEIVRFDWRQEMLLDDVVASVPAGSELRVAASTDLVWIDQTDGGFVWAVNPWGLNVIRKDDNSTPLLGESGEVLESGDDGSATAAAAAGGSTAELEREPDDNGVDDPPVAVDDPVVARAGAPVPVAVTVNDYDPDGEAIVLASVGGAEHGSVEIATATTVVYQPESGFVGIDRFDYTIVDGNGTEASATVTIELLPTDATNQAPVGSPDMAETGPGAPVVIDVLLNDIDPERDSLRIDSFAPPDVGGTVTETLAPSGLAGLRFEPPRDASGTASFTYRPVDSYGAVGEPVVVQVEIAQPSDENRPPIVLPDAARVRRDIPARIAVLANDRDPDGDRLQVSLVEPLPPGLDARFEGTELEVTARAGAADLVPFAYVADDGRGHRVVGSVLVAVIDEAEPNRPPIANADSATAVVGEPQLIDVLANDSDPDGDPLVVVAVRQADDGGGAVSVQGDRVRYLAAPLTGDEATGLVRFTYVISDGNGHEVPGEVTVRVLPEPIAAPPFAQDDSATTEVDLPVTLDVLRNDGDPSGERPTIVGTPGCAGGGRAVVTADSRVTFTPPSGVAGVFSCSYEVTNSQGLRAGASIVISVLEPEIANLPPTVNDESVTVIVDEQIVVDVLANDDDPDGDPSDLRVLSSTTPLVGRAVRSGGQIAYEAPSIAGVVAITYQVGDANGGVTAGNLVIRVVEPDPIPPSALDDRRTIVGPGVRTVLDVLANDADPDGGVGTLQVTVASLVAGDGSIVVGSSTITFDPDPEFVGDLIVDYTIEDTDGLADSARAILTVLEAPNRPPVARDDVAEVVNGGTVIIAIALNDADPDGDLLTYSLTSSPDAALGTARLDNNSIVFTAVPGASGTARFGYRIDDGEDSADGEVTVRVLPCSAAPPEAPDLFLETGYQQPIAVDLAAVARNGEIVDVGGPLFAPSGVYTPPAGQNGNVTFTYAVRNSCRIQDVGQVTIDVNQDPTGRPYEVEIGRLATFTIPISQLASDDEPLTIVGLENAPTWVSVIDSQRAVFVDPAGRVDGASFTAVITDPGGLVVRVPMVIRLVNLAPVAQPDSVRSIDGPVDVDLLANDTDPENDAVSFASIPETFTFANGAVGTIARLPDGRLRLDPVDGFGKASFTYTVQDAVGAVSQPATVQVTVNAAPVAPTVDIDIPALSTEIIPILASDPDHDAHTLRLAITGPIPNDVTITVLGLELTVVAGNVPNGQRNRPTDVAYTVTDPVGAVTTGTLVVTVIDPLPTTTTSTTTTSTTTTSTTTTVPDVSTTTVPTTTTSTTTTSTTTTVPTTIP